MAWNIIDMVSASFDFKESSSSCTNYKVSVYVVAEYEVQNKEIHWKKPVLLY